MSNRFGGNKHKRYKKVATVDKREEIPYKEGNKVYAQVKTRLGGKRIQVVCDDGITRQAIIPGGMYKRTWLNPGDILLVQVEEMLKGDCTIVCKYNDSQIRKLKAEKSLGFKLEEYSNDNSNVTFGDGENYDSDEEENIFDKVDQEISIIPNKDSQKNSNLKRLNDRNKKQDVDINDVPENIDFDDL